MKNHKHSKRYANMFLNTVGIDNAPGALEELATVNALMQKSPELKSLLVSPLFAVDERTETFRAVGQKLGLSDNTVNFVNYLAGEEAAWAMGAILDKAVAIYSEKKKKVKAVVITPSTIGPEYEERLREALKKITERDVSLEYRTDPDLLGGMLIKVGSRMFDSSIKGQLRLLKEELIKG